jgi:hypothetical protein
LQEHSHQVAAQDNPEQFVPELSSALDVGGEIARVYVGDAGDKGRSEISFCWWGAGLSPATLASRKTLGEY